MMAFLLLNIGLEAQEISRKTIDSLQENLSQLDVEDHYWEISASYSSLASTFESISIDSAILYGQQHIDFLKQNYNPSPKRDSVIAGIFLTLSYLHTTFAYPSDSTLELGLAYCDSAINRQGALNHTTYQAYAYNNKGALLYSGGDLSGSAEVLNKAFELSHFIENADNQAYLQQSLLLNIGRSHIGLKQWDQAIAATKKALHRHNYLPFVNACQLNLSAIYLEANTIDSSLHYSKIAYKLADSLGYGQNKLFASINIAESLLGLKRYQEANTIIDRNINLMQAEDSYAPYLALSFHQKAEIKRVNGSLDSAIIYMEQALPYAEQSADPEFLEDLYWNLADNLQEQGNYQKALDYFKRFQASKDSLRSAESRSDFNELLVQYESLEKEQKIAQQKAEILEGEKQLWLSLTIFSLLSLGGIIYYIQRRQKQERRHQQEILAEKEKGMAAMISATESERKRISKDLHDGIGQKLSALKLGLLHLKTSIKDPELKNDLNEISAEFSKSAEEVRSISHQMMPRALMENGLISALEDLCESSFKFSAINYSFDHHGLKNRYPESIEISLYRICQELLNNALKHAQANEIQLQLMEIKGKLILLVEDNGKGISSENTKGHGLMNIKSRIDYLKGTVNFEPGPETGMLATITIPLKT